MRNEAPPISVITAIANSGQEDFFAQLLFSRGWNILFRALSERDLLTYLGKQSEREDFLLLYSSDLLSIEGIEQMDNLVRERTLAIEDLPGDREEVVRYLREFARNKLNTNKVLSAHRPPLMQSPQNLIFQKRDFWCVTGTKGVSGKSLTATLLANFSAQNQNTLLIDSDVENQNLSYLVGEANLRNPKNKLELIKIKPKENFDYLQLEMSGKKAIADLGWLRSNLLEDRRRGGLLQNEAFALASQIIYCVSARPASLNAFEYFLRNLNEFEYSDKLFLLFNEMGPRENLREARKIFQSLAQGFPNASLPLSTQLQEHYPIGNKGRNTDRTIEKIFQMLG